MTFIPKSSTDRERRANRAKQLADKFTNSKIDNFFEEVKKYMKTDLTPVEAARLKRYLGEHLALAYGVGWMNANEKVKLYAPSGAEL